MSKILRRLPLFLIAALVVSGLVYGFMDRPVPVELATVERGPLSVKVEEDGKTRIRQRYVVTAPIAGKLNRIPFKVGEDLKLYHDKGRPLATIEPSRATLLDARSLAEAKAREEAAKARKDEAMERLEKCRRQEKHAQSEYDRVTRAAMSGGSTRQEVDDAELKLRSAEHDLAGARFAVRVAEFELKQAAAVLKPFVSPGEIEKIEIGTPIPRGKVLRVFQESEGNVALGAQLLEVGDTEDIEAEIDVLTSDAVKIHDGDEAELEHWGGPVPLKGNVAYTEPSGFTKISALGVEEQRVNVIIRFKVPEEYRRQVRDAYRVEARITIWQSQSALKVPTGALFRVGNEWAVYVAEEGRAVLRKVKIDHNNGRDAEVLDGLREGDRVVKHPGDKIKDDTAIVERKKE